MTSVAYSEPITLSAPRSRSPAAAGSTRPANVLEIWCTISETLVATEYRPTPAGATKAGSIAMSSRAFTS